MAKKYNYSAFETEEKKYDYSAFGESVKKKDETIPSPSSSPLSPSEEKYKPILPPTDLSPEGGIDEPIIEQQKEKAPVISKEEMKSMLPKIDDMIKAIDEKASLTVGENIHLYGFGKAQGDLLLARRTLNKTKRLIQASDKEGMNAALSGLRRKDLGEYLTLGTSETLSEFKTMNIVNKMNNGEDLTDEEHLVLSSRYLFDIIDANKDKPSSYVIGNAIGEIAPFIGQLVLTKGIGAAAEQGAVAAGRKVLTQQAAGVLKKYGLADAIKTMAGASAQAPLMPMMWTRYAKERIGVLDVDENGKLVQVDGASKGSALLESYGTTVSAIFSEKIGDVMRKNFGTIGTRLGESTMTTKTMQAIKNFKKDAYWSGLGWEYFEEQVDAVGQAIASDDAKLSDILDVKQQFETFVTLAVVGSGFKAVEQAGYLKDKVFKKEFDKVQETFEDRVDGFTRREISNATDASNVTDMFNRLKDVDISHLTPIQQKVVYDYIGGKIKYKTLFEASQVKPEEGKEPPKEAAPGITDPRTVPETAKEKFDKLLGEEEELTPEEKELQEKYGRFGNAENELEVKNEPLEDKQDIIQGGQDNAIPQRSTEALPMGETPGDSKEMGTRIPEPEKSAETRQENAPPGANVKEAPQITWNNKVYKTENELKTALANNEITGSEYENANRMLSQERFNAAKDRLASNLQSLFTKEAVGDKKPDAVELYNSLVDYIKEAIKLYGDKIRTSRDVAKHLNVKHNKMLRDAFDEATGRKVMDEEQKMRGFPKRIKEFEEFKDIKIDIENSPELKYKPQKLAEVKERLADMTDDEVVRASTDMELNNMSNSSENVQIAAYAERINRARAKGEDIMPVIKEMSVKGTAFGQLIRQFAEIKGTIPENVVESLSAKLEESGRFLTPEQKISLTELAKQDIDARQKFKEQEKRVKVLFTEEEVKKTNQLKKEAERAYVKLAQTIQDIIPKDTWDMLGMMVQGNLLTPLSQMTNIYANIMNIPLQVSSNVIATIPDMVDSYIISHAKRTTSMNPKIAGAYMKGMYKGTKEALKQMATGVNVSEKAEIQRGFAPFRSLYQAFSGKNMPVNAKGKIPTTDRIKKITEGLIGVPPEIMFRALNLGDKPFYRASERAALTRMGLLKGLKGEELKRFVDFPSQSAEKKAIEKAREATFQEHGKIAEFATTFTGSIYKATRDGKMKLGSVDFGGPVRFIVKTQMPYVRTPSNIISQTLDFAIPIIPLTKAMNYAYRRDMHECYVNIGKAATGVMMNMAAQVLIKNGLVSGSPDEDEKVRNIGYDRFPPNSVNISGLKRYLNGEDPSYRPDDYFVNTMKMGIPGMVIGIKINVSEAERNITKENSELTERARRTMATILEVPSYTLEQSFLRGTSALLQAISEKEWDYWLANTWGAITSVPLPNTLTAINRATREYIPELKGDNLEERLDNVIKNKTFQTEDLPIKINLWGEPILQTPKGSNAWFYQLFDVTKTQSVKENPASDLIYNIYKKTEDAGCLPSVPKKSFRYNKQDVLLEDKEYELLLRNVGKKRYQAVIDNINAGTFNLLNDESKIKTLQNIYGKAYDVAKVETMEQLKKP